MRKTFIAARAEDGIRLSHFLRARCSEFTGKVLQAALHEGVCSVNGHVERFASRRLKHGDSIVVDIERIERVRDLPTSAKPAVLMEDASLLCVNKPAGLVCSAEAFPDSILVHRLDKGTSGCLLLAKTERAAQAMKRLFSQRELYKVYLAIVHGAPKKNRWTMHTHLGVDRKIDGQTLYRSTTSREGREAMTVLTVEKRGAFSLVRAVIQTGRTHQIRVHLAESGFPIVGDMQYGQKSPPSHVVRPLLHAYGLSFTHPISRRACRIYAPIPEDMARLLNQASY